MKMNKEIISGKTYCETLEKIIGIMRRRKVDLNVRHILFVPDKYTLYAEKLLYRDSSGAFDAEVLTLNRLFFRLCDGEGYLPKQGAVMLTRRIVDGMQKKDELACFSRSARFSGFAEKLYETMAQLAACRILPEDLPALSGALGLKMQDVKSVYSEYLRRTKEKYIDSAGRMELLLSALDTTETLKNTVVYFANFDSYTEQTRRVIDKICEKAPLSYVGAAASETFTFGEAELYEATDEITEVKAAAKRIRNDAFENIPYGQICVVTPDPAAGRIERIFTEFGIPFYLDKKYILGEHPLVRCLKLLLSLAKYPRREGMISLARNFYAGIDPDAADLFENYCNQFLIDYRGFYEPFTKGFPESVETERDARTARNIDVAEQVRRALLSLLAPFYDVAAAPVQAETFVGAVNAAFLLLNEAEKTRALETVSLWPASVKERIESQCALLCGVFGDEKQDADVLSGALFESLDATEVSVLPPRGGTVTVGTPEAFRGARFRRVYVLGFNEGALPSVQNDCGMISDREIDRLAALGVKVEPKIAEVNDRARTELLNVLAGAESLFLSYVFGGEKKPSTLLSYIEPLCEKVTENSTAAERFRLAESTDADLIARHVSSYAGAKEMLALGVCKNAETPCKFLPELFAALGGDAKKLLPGVNRSHPDLTPGEDFFFRGGTTTISRIQEYYACPYKHFLKLGLRLLPREDGRLSPLDIGNFLHKVIEIFVANGDYSNVPETVQTLVEQTAEQEVKYRLKANDGIIRQIAGEAKQIAAIVARQIQGGSFEPMGQEIHFSEGSKQLRSVAVPLKNATVYLKGVIDRADRMGQYARVVDYKTGQTEFSFTDLYYGRKIQLPLYMRILEENGFLPAGMFYFPFAVGWGDDAFSHRLLGVYNSDPALLEGMDAALKNCDVKSEILSAATRVAPDRNGVPVLKKSPYAFTTGELKKIAEYAFAVLKNGAEEIASGRIAPSPCRNGDRLTCDYCEVKAACNFDRLTGKVRTLKKTDAAFVLSSIETEEPQGDAL